MPPTDVRAAALYPILKRRWSTAVFGLLLAGFGDGAHAQTRVPAFACLNEATALSTQPNWTEAMQPSPWAQRVCPALRRMLVDALQTPAMVMPAPRGYNSIDSFYVAQGDRRYHLKILADQSETQVHKSAAERAAAGLGARLGLSPDVWLDPLDPALLLTAFVRGRSLDVAEAPRQLRVQQTVKALGHLHEATQTGLTGAIVGAAMLADLHSFATAIAQDAPRTSPGPAATPHALCRSLTELWAWAAHIASVLDGTPFPVTACHGDLQADNLLWDGTRVWLLDWGEATMNDPMSDFVDLAFNLSVGVADLAQMLRPVAPDPQTLRRGEYKLAWAHVRRYFTAYLGMRWDKPEDRDVKLIYLQDLIAQDMAHLGAVP